MSKKPSVPQSDSELIGEILRGRKHVFQELFTRYQADVKKLIWSFFRKKDIVDDLAQEIFEKAFSNVGSIQKPEKFRCWLFQISRNTCVDFGRRKNILCETPMEYLENEPSAPLISFEESTPADENAIKALLEKLSPRDGLIVWLSYVEDFSYADIAQIVDLGEEAVRQRAFRAIRFLRGQVK